MRLISTSPKRTLGSEAAGDACPPARGPAANVAAKPAEDLRKFLRLLMVSSPRCVYGHTSVGQLLQAAHDAQISSKKGTKSNSRVRDRRYRTKCCTRQPRADSYSAKAKGDQRTLIGAPPRWPAIKDWRWVENG